MNAQDFEILSTIKLKFLRLCLRNDNQNFDEKMVEILEFVVGIPHLRLQYVGACWDPDKFEIFLVNWVIKNGYIKSLVCSANDGFLRSHIVFKSCSKINMFDEVDDNININK
uniref:FBD domain-containing protein n=1 Tax=Panagrolaimus superbus TaxID=310955 RepID=A0A914YH95_9BILA